MCKSKVKRKGKKGHENLNKDGKMMILKQVVLTIDDDKVDAKTRMRIGMMTLKENADAQLSLFRFFAFSHQSMTRL